MAFKTFAPGVLTSSDVNTFLMRQAVIACTSSTRPASPSEGMTIYETDTDLALIYTGTAWQPIVNVGDWTAYTPTLTNITIGNGTVVARYQQIGKTTTVFFKLTFGSTTAFPGGVPNFSLPFTAARELGRVVNTNLQDAGTADLPGLSYASQTGVFIGVQNVSGTYPFINDVSATVPFTWTTSDTVTCQLTYEAV
jgi:hypothetical protein